MITIRKKPDAFCNKLFITFCNKIVVMKKKFCCTPSTKTPKFEVYVILQNVSFWVMLYGLFALYFNHFSFITSYIIFFIFLQEESNQNKIFFITKKTLPWPNETYNKPSNVLQWFPNLGANSYILFLILVSTLHFSERKNW